MVNRRKTLLPLLMLSLCFGLIIFRLFTIQVWNHQKLSAAVQRMVQRERPETPCRGMILDTSGRILAMSVKKYTVYADPKMIRDPRSIEARLSSVPIPVTAGIITHAKNTSYVPLARELDMTQMQKIKDLNLKGIGFESEYERQYPEGRLACHLLGVVGKDGSGLEGVELNQNAFLSGEKIKQLRYRDGRGREIAERLINSDALKGANIYLTIDRNLQFIAEQELERSWKESSARRAMVILQDPFSGEIKAMASYPSFDPNSFGGEQSLKNPLIADVFEPGSTFKLVTLAAGLEEKAFTPQDVIWCENGKYKVAKHTIKDHEKKGSLTVSQVMEYSSNIGTAKIGQRLGKETLYQYVRQFGFGSPSGIDLPGETKGLLKNPESWSGLSLPIISFGQEIGVTAIQVINAYSSIANGGMLMEPKTVKEIKNPGGDVLYSVEKRVIRRSVSAETAEQMKQMLVGVVERGTGQMAQVPGYSVGGKTGTAQKRDPKTGRYSSSCYVASFCGIIPVSQPRLTILVLLDEPKGDYWGSSRAAPLFARIAKRAVHYLQIPPDREPLQVCKVALAGDSSGKK